MGMTKYEMCDFSRQAQLAVRNRQASGNRVMLHSPVGDDDDIPPQNKKNLGYHGDSNDENPLDAMGPGG